MTGTIAVDFDKVVHWYREGWRDGEIYDQPVPGAFDGLRTLMAEGPVCIFTTRSPAPVAEWITTRSDIPTLVDDGFVEFWNERDKLLVTQRKLPCVAYLDDRAVRFGGNWAAALAELAAVLCADAGEATEAHPNYLKVPRQDGSGLVMIVCDQGWRASVVCDGMRDAEADWLTDVLGRRPYAPGRL